MTTKAEELKRENTERRAWWRGASTAALIVGWAFYLFFTFHTEATMYLKDGEEIGCQGIAYDDGFLYCLRESVRVGYPAYQVESADTGTL